MDVGCGSGSRLNDAEGTLGHGVIDFWFNCAVAAKTVSSATARIPVFVTELEQHFRKLVGGLEARDLLAQSGVVNVQHVNRNHYPGAGSDPTGEVEQIRNRIVPRHID